MVSHAEPGAASCNVKAAVFAIGLGAACAAQAAESPPPTGFDVAIPRTELAAIAKGDVVDLLITVPNEKTGQKETLSYAQVARVLEVSNGSARLSTGSGLLPKLAQAALDRGGRARLLLRGAGDATHETHLGLLTPENVRKWQSDGLAMKDILPVPISTNFARLAPPLFEIGKTATGLTVPSGWRAVAVARPRDVAIKAGARVDASLRYAREPPLSLWKDLPVLRVDKKIVWLSMPSGAARALVYALDALGPATLTLAAKTDR